MGRRQRARPDGPHDEWHGEFCHVVGEPRFVTLEHADDPEKIDHVWIEMEVAGVGRLRAVVNTWSRRNEAEGFDPRMRMAIVRRRFDRKPASVIEPCGGLDYAEIEAGANAAYELLERRPMELLLTEKAAAASWIEAWGDVYAKDGQLGIHQIHSRRASCAVSQDLRKRDGALRFYDDASGESELLLIKFCGQP